MGMAIARHQGDLLFECKVGNHTLLSDVPERVGGKDRGMTGTELLAASLASCVAAMVTFHCGRAGVDAGDMSVEVAYDWAVNPYRLVNVKVKIHLPRVSDAERRQAVLEAARHCPVHETICSLDSVEFQLAD